MIRDTAMVMVDGKWFADAKQFQMVCDELTRLRADLAEAKEEISALEKRRGGECDTCNGWVCPPLRCVACMMTKWISPASDPGPLAADAIRKQDADLLALRETVRVLGEEVRAIWAVYNANLDAVTDGGCSLHNAIAAAVDARNANPGARAAVEKP